MNLYNTIFEQVLNIVPETSKKPSGIIQEEIMDILELFPTHRRKKEVARNRQIHKNISRPW